MSKKSPNWKYLRLNGELNRDYIVTKNGEILTAKGRKPVSTYNDAKVHSVLKGDKTRVRINGKFYYVDRLVCETWNGTPENQDLYCVHKDGNLENNNPPNLMWGDARDVAQIVKAISKNANPFASKMVKNRNKIIKELAKVSEGNATLADIARRFNVNSRSLGRFLWGM